LRQFLKKEEIIMAVFRVEKTRDFTIMSNHHLRNSTLSLKAKGLQSLMLSLPESWDFTTKGLACICKEGVDSITSALGELERHGYLTRRRLRDELGRLADIEYIIHEQPVEPKTPEAATFSPKRENPRLDNPRQGDPVLAKPVLENPAQYNTNRSNIKKSNNDQSIHPSIAQESPRLSQDEAYGMDGMDRIEAVRSLIERNIEYDCLIQQYGRERMDEIVELMLETLCSTRPQIRIASDDYPSSAVKSRLLSVTSTHIQYVFDTMDQHTGKINNIKAYLLTVLYNAPVTIHHYYRAGVNHQFGG
jgi:hypothetical protein